MSLPQLYVDVVPRFLTLPDLLLTTSHLSSSQGLLWGPTSGGDPARQPLPFLSCQWNPSSVWAAVYSVPLLNCDWSKAGIGQVQLPTLLVNKVLLKQRHPAVYCSHAMTAELSGCGRLACKDLTISCCLLQKKKKLAGYCGNPILLCQD